MNDLQKNALKRIITALIGLPLYTIFIFTNKFYCLPILGVSLIISIACLWEYYEMTDRGPEGRPFLVEGISVAVIINVFFYFFAFGHRFIHLSYINYRNPMGIMGFVIIIIAVAMALQVFGRPIKGATHSLAVTVFGVFFFAVFTSHIIPMRALVNGPFYIFILNAVLMANDSGAYFGGVLFGKHKTGFAVSPNKTWEGYFSGILFCVFMMHFFNWLFKYFFAVRLFNNLEASLLAIALSFLGNIGDLVESVMKRDNNVKDSGRSIPGHGGMWDAFDSVIFSLPFFYYYLIIKGVT